MNKSLLRQTMQTLLCAMSAEDVVRKSATVTQQMLASGWWHGAEVIWIFCSMPKEVDTHAMIQAALQLGKIVVVPRVQQADMIFHQITSLDADGDFTIGTWGIKEPCEQLPMLRPDALAPHTSLIVTPGLAFDRTRHRLGRGKGYYDRFLAHIRHCEQVQTHAIGVCFAEQIVEDVPVTPVDQTVDGIITDREILL